jgi:hypothetical protein
MLRFQTDNGFFWFKANAIGTAHEIPLVEALARWAPGYVLEPLAADARQGWLLLPDGGTTLLAGPGETEIDQWAEILTDHAELQRLMAPHADDLVSLGIPDLRPARLPEIRAELLADEAALRMGLTGGLTSEERQRLQDDQERYAAVCADLEAIGVPASVNHDDLHDNNVFAPAQPGGHHRVFDWGDASVAHPFAVLLIALRVVESQRKLQPGDADLLRLRDAYLEPWSGDFDRAELIEAVRLALRVGGVSRAQSYRAALLEGNAADLAEWGDGLPQWLRETYDPTPVDPDPW